MKPIRALSYAIAMTLLSFSSTAVAQSTADDDAAFIIARHDTEQHQVLLRTFADSILLGNYGLAIAELGGTILDEQRFVGALPNDTIAATDSALRTLLTNMLLSAELPEDLADFAAYLRDNPEPLDDDVHDDMPRPLATGPATFVGMSMLLGIHMALNNGLIEVVADMHTPEMPEIVETPDIIRFANRIARRDAADAIRAGLN